MCILPYIDEGTSGLIWGMLQNTKQWEFGRVFRDFGRFVFQNLQGQSRVYWGINDVLPLAYERHPNLYLRFIENQSCFSAINYVEIHNGLPCNLENSHGDN